MLVEGIKNRPFELNCFPFKTNKSEKKEKLFLLITTDGLSNIHQVKISKYPEL
jgi:hypothetical protein